MLQGGEVNPYARVETIATIMWDTSGSTVKETAKLSEAVIEQRAKEFAARAASQALGITTDAPPPPRPAAAAPQASAAPAPAKRAAGKTYLSLSAWKAGRS
tara:strand:- start:653 stop:955 length:303 start_codon:yes stop_codon:yes gene_type:complete